MTSPPLTHHPAPHPCTDPCTNPCTAQLAHQPNPQSLSNGTKWTGYTVYCCCINKLSFFQDKSLMTLNRSSREPGGQASNWRPPGNQNHTGNRFQNFSATEVNTSERLVLPSSDQQRDQNQNSQKLKRTTKTSPMQRHRRVVLRRRLFDVMSLTTLIVLSVALLTTAQPIEGNFFSTFS